MEKLEIGTRIRITKVPDRYWPYFSVGDEAAVHHYDEDGDMWAEFDKKMEDGIWCVTQKHATADFEVLDQALTHAEYYERYGELTEERIRDLLAVYAKAVKYAYAPSREVQDLIDRVREIDEAAADYLVQVRCDSACLMAAFNWAESPQGADYWGDIAYELGEIT